MNKLRYFVKNQKVSQELTIPFCHTDQDTSRAPSQMKINFSSEHFHWTSIIVIDAFCHNIGTNLVVFFCLTGMKKCPTKMWTFHIITGVVTFGFP